MTEQNRWKRGDPAERGWYVVREHIVGDWCYSTDFWLGCVDGWGSGSHRDRIEHLPMILEDCMEPLPQHETEREEPSHLGDEGDECSWVVLEPKS